ncbi:glycosyl hydrolase family 76-domain-containing protein [Xylariales sp. PMI_506]|nr:glycosyl hydrolase family 76-domain-containing protein [Xylariales sp. PMI_506]
MKQVASQMVADMMTFYKGDQPGQTPGLLPQPYYWWEAGAMFGSLIDYWYYTGDTTYNEITTQGLLFQVGPYNDYMPPNQTLTEGNDDQGFWGMSAMTAAEYKYPDPPSDQPQWLALAQAVFNTQAARWDSADCNGGLRWQIFTWNNGYDYKNSISQACFFNLAARLALYTGNSSYADWATKTWDWMTGVGFMDENYHVFDGSHIENNCTSPVAYQFSYNAGAFLLGAAAMYAFAETNKNTNDQAIWHERVDGVLNGTSVFFFSENGQDPIMFESACEGVGLCDLDQQSFKAYLSRWMAATTKWAPWTSAQIMPLLQNSATAAAKQCTGGNNGRMCGLKWANNSGAWDGTTGVGQQMAAMEVVLANLIKDSPIPVTNLTGGTSVGNSGGGGSDIGQTNPSGSSIATSPLTTGDRVGAIILTILVCASALAVLVFMMIDETKSTHENLSAIQKTLAKGPRTSVLVKAGGFAALPEKGKTPATAWSSSEPSEQAGDFPLSSNISSGHGTPLSMVAFVDPRETRGLSPNSTHGSFASSGMRRPLQKKNRTLIP